MSSESAADRVFIALTRLPPRDGQLLIRFALEQQSLESLVTLYGTSAAALRWSLARALISLEAQINETSSLQLDDVKAARYAERLTTPQAVEIKVLASLYECGAHSNWKATLAQLAHQAQNSPSALAFERARGWLVWALIAVSALLFFRNDPLAQGAVQFAHTLWTKMTKH